MDLYSRLITVRHRRVSEDTYTLLSDRVSSLFALVLRLAMQLQRNKKNKKNKEGIKLNYYFQAVQQQRVVPLARYGVLPQSAPQSRGSPPTSPIDMMTEQATRHAQELTTINQALQAQLADLQRRNEKLLQTNESMARKITTMGHFQPVGYVHVNQPLSADDFPPKQDTTTTPTQKSHADEPAQTTTHALPQIPPHDPLPAEYPLTQQPAQPKALPDKNATKFDT